MTASKITLFIQESCSIIDTFSPKSSNGILVAFADMRVQFMETIDSPIKLLLNQTLLPLALFLELVL